MSFVEDKSLYVLPSSEESCADGINCCQCFSFIDFLLLSALDLVAYSRMLNQRIVDLYLFLWWYSGLEHSKN